MSTMTQAQPETAVLETAVPARLLSVPLAATFAAEFTSLTSFFLLLSVMPMLAAAAGASSSGAGLITGSMLLRAPQAVMVAVSLVRGFGFGLCGVATGALTARLLPPERRGEGLGLLGIVTGVPAIVALPAGIWLAGHHLAAVAAVVAAATGLLPLASIRWLPDGREAG